MCLHDVTASVIVNGHTWYPQDAAEIRLEDHGRCDGEYGTHHRITITLAFPDPAFTWQLAYAVATDGSHLIITSTLHNDSPDQMILGTWNLLTVDRVRGSVLDLGPEPDGCTVFQMATWDTRVKQITSDDGTHRSQYLGHFYNPTSGETLCASFVTVDRIICEHHVTYSQQGIESYSACCAFRNHELPAGGTITSETLWIEHARDPYLPLQRWAERVQARYQPRLNPRTTVGWLGWAWVDSLSPREETPEAVVLGNAAAIRTRLPGFEIDYIWMSQVNLKEMVPGNWMEFNSEHFPGGFENTLRQLQALDFVPGLWIAPFWLFGQATPVEENRDNLVRKKDGTLLALRGPWEFIQSTSKEHDEFDVYFLDGSHPNTLTFMRKVFTFYRELGIRYVMLDFLGCGHERTVWDKRRVWSEADRMLMAEIREAAGPDTHLLSAVGSTPLYTGCVDAARVNTDYGEGRPLYPPFHCLYNATYVVNDRYYGNVYAFLQNMASTYFTHRRLYINDLNLMTIDTPVPRKLAEMTATIFGLSGSPIMLGDDIRTIDDERLTLIKQCLPRSPETAVPLDLFTHAWPANYARELVLPVTTPWDEYLLLAVFNLDDTAYRTEFTTEQLGLQPQTAYRIFDFWDESYAGQFTDRLACEVPAQACRLLRIAAARAHPWLLATNMHVRQGQVEILALQWDADAMCLRGQATRPAGERGSLYFLMPNDWYLVNHEGHKLMKDGRDNSVIIRREMAFTQPVMDFELQFAPLESAKGIYG